MLRFRVLLINENLLMNDNAFYNSEIKKNTMDFNKVQSQQQQQRKRQHH